MIPVVEGPDLPSRRQLLLTALGGLVCMPSLLAQAQEVLSQPRPGTVQGLSGGATSPSAAEVSAPAAASPALETTPPVRVHPASLKIGVLLPLSGRFAPPGLEVKRGMEVAQRILPPTDKGPLQLCFRDTQDDPAQTVAAMKDLVAKEQVVAFVGPLVSATAEAAAQCAVGLQVPLLALTQRPLVAPVVPPWVFRLMFTPRQQMVALAAYVCDRLGLRRFGVAAPDSRYAAELSALFIEQVQARGGQILARQSYPSGTTRFAPVVKGLLQAASAAPPGEAGVGTALEPGSNPAGSGGASGSSRRDAPFDALFVPDTVTAVSQLAAALAWAEVPVGAFLKGGMRSPMRLVGTSAWNTPQLPILGGKYLEDALFVDLFFAGSADPSVQRFVKGWKDTFQSTWPHPPEALGALGYDAFGLLHALLIEGPQTPEVLAGLFRRVEGYQGVTGTLAFDAQGEALRSPPVISVASGLLVQVEPLFVAPGSAPSPLLPPDDPRTLPGLERP